MVTLRMLASRLGALFHKRRLESDLADEMRAHLAMPTEENVRRGMLPEDARYAALREFGGVEQVKEEYREQRGWPMMETLIQDLRYGLRQLRRNPGFTTVAVLTLALGIGANTAIFSVVNSVLLRPLPYPGSDRLVWITEVIPALRAELAGGGDYADWKDQNQTLEQLTAYDDAGSFNLTGRGTPARVHAAQVSASFFATLGVAPQLGRPFTREEDRPNAGKLTILMQSFWQQYYGSDPQVLGKTVTLNAAPYTVVGVMPASFKFPGESDVQMLLPLQLNEASERLRVRQQFVRIIGLLKPGASLARTFADLDAIRKRAQPAVFGGPGPGDAAGGPSTMPAPPPGPHSMMGITGPGPGPAPAPAGSAGNTITMPAGPSSEQHPRPPARELRTSWTQAGRPGANAPPPGAPRIRRGPLGRPPESELKVVPLAEHLAGNLRPAVLTLLGVVGLVLLIACANVANLVLTRASARTREVAVRAVLGAGRWRLVRQLLSESVILALAGGVAGLLLAVWGADTMTRLIPASVGGDILSVVRVRLDSHVLLFALAVSFVTGILFGMAPALAATRPDLAEKLKEGAQVASVGPRGSLLRGALAVAELSLALVLLIGAGLLIKSFYRLLAVDPGFAPERVLTMNINLTDSRYPRPAQKRAFFSEALRRAESLPGVRSAALGDSLPLTPYRVRLMIRRDIATPAGPAPGSTTVMMSRLSVSPGYFYTLGIPVLKGRTFTDHDDEQSRKVAVVNEALARRLWPTEDPVGRPLPLLDESLSVIGVVGNTRHEGLGQDPASEIYVPYLQQPEDSMQLAVRTVQDPASLASAVRGQVAAIDREQPIYNVTTLEQTLSNSVAPRRFNMLLLGIFAAMALTLATVGIYGVMACSVTQRTHEIGIRMALGAERRDVLGLVVRHGLRLTLIGVILGVAGAWALTRFLTGFLYGVRPTDFPTFVLFSLLLAAVALLASYIPARRATRVDPIVALRYE